MTPEFAEKWAAALESGKYTQGRVYLRSEKEGYCCLGVLCDLLDPEQWGRNDGPYGHYGLLHFPSRDILKMVDLSESEAMEFAGWNDHGCTFETIADRIRHRYPATDAA